MSVTPVRSVVVVDDNEDLRQTLLDYAEAVGTEAWGASHGLEALWIVKHHRPELVLLDLTMPRLDGFETIRHMRKFDPTQRIVVITGDMSDTTRARITALGLELIVKPIGLPTLDGIFRVNPTEASTHPG